MAVLYFGFFHLFFSSKLFIFHPFCSRIICFAHVRVPTCDTSFTHATGQIFYLTWYNILRQLKVLNIISWALQ